MYKKRQQTHGLLSHKSQRISSPRDTLRDSDPTLHLGGVEQTREAADLAAGALGRDDALAGGLAQGGDGLIQRTGEPFFFGGNGFAEGANGMFNTGTACTVALGANGSLTNTFKG